MGEMVDVAACEHARTEKAVLLSKDGHRRTATWIPISMLSEKPKKGRGKEGAIGNVELSRSRKNYSIFSMPGWLASKENLLA